MAFIANSHPRAVRSMMRVTHSLKALAMAKRAAVKAVKFPAPSRDMQLPILQRIVEVLRERGEGMLEMRGSTGRGLLKLIISEHIHHFQWPTRHMVNHYIATRPDVELIGTVIKTNSNNHAQEQGWIAPSVSRNAHASC
jgi:hypothetical protein